MSAQEYLGSILLDRALVRQYKQNTTMRIVNLFAILVAIAAPVTEAAKLLEHDVLAAEGVFKLGIHLATNGLPKPGTCTLDKLSIRKEW